MDVVEYKTTLLPHDNVVRCKVVLTIIDHLTIVAAVCPLPNKETETVARALIDRVIGAFEPPERLHSDQGPEFESQVIHQLQQTLGYHKTRMTPYITQENSVLERLHATFHAMLCTVTSDDNTGVTGPICTTHV